MVLHMPSEGGSNLGPGIRWKRHLVLVAFGLLAGLLVIELSVRGAMRIPFYWGEGDISDPALGNVCRPHFSYCNPIHAFCISTGDYGTRRNGNTPPRAERPLTLAVGDSFVFGDDVGDADSWPAILERLTGRRVINGGVPAFGLDQTVLRSEQLAKVYSPEIIILSFIPDDVRRSEMSYFSGHAKPYFDVDGGMLRLYPAPVPPASALAPLKRLLSVSLMVNVLFDQFMHWDGPATQVVHQHGREVACLLMGRIATAVRASTARVLILAQPEAADATPEHLQVKNLVLGCAATAGLQVLDLFPIIERMPASQRQRLFDGHMTAEGNRVVATALAGVFEHEGEDPDRPPIR